MEKTQGGQVAVSGTGEGRVWALAKQNTQSQGQSIELPPAPGAAEGRKDDRQGRVAVF